jgi:hypothetical protein
MNFKMYQKQVFLPTVLHIIQISYACNTGTSTTSDGKCSYGSVLIGRACEGILSKANT